MNVDKSKEKVLKRFDDYVDILSKPLRRFAEADLGNFTVKSDLFGYGFKIREVDQILSESPHSRPDVSKKRAVTEGEEGKQKPGQQDRFGLIKKVLIAEFGLDPEQYIDHDFRQIGDETVDRYLVRVQYKGEDLCLIITNWYAHAVYITKESNYDKHFGPAQLAKHGAERFYWIYENDGKESPEKIFDELTKKIKDRFEKLVP